VDCPRLDKSSSIVGRARGARAKRRGRGGKVEESKCSYCLGSNAALSSQGGGGSGSSRKGGEMEIGVAE